MPNPDRSQVAQILGLYVEVILASFLEPLGPISEKGLLALALFPKQLDPHPSVGPRVVAVPRVDPRTVVYVRRHNFKLGILLTCVNRERGLQTPAPLCVIAKLPNWS